LAETVAVMAADMDDLKRLNTAMSRPTHYSQHAFILDYCDRNGILLIPEVPAWQLTGNHMVREDMRDLERLQLCELIAANFNHPSVWAWSIGNEIESKVIDGREFVRDMIAYTKSLDPTRPVGFASYHILGGRTWDDGTRFADFVMLNQYFGSWHGPKDSLGPALDIIHASWPDKVVLISEYGFSPHWQQYSGPVILDPEQYYVAPVEAPKGSEEADAQRCRVIVEQNEVFRGKPFVAGAIFWVYQDYRTYSGFVMGVVDEERNRHGSWRVLREEYAPVLIESVRFAPGSGDRCSAVVALRARGPVESDMPAYTLRGYSLHWAVRPPGDGEPISEEVLALPVLEPGAAWEGEVRWVEPGKEHDLVLSVVRPTGAVVLERVYSSSGERQDG
jgi:hypothetical protein